MADVVSTSPETPSLAGTSLEIHNSDVATYKTCRQLWDFTSPLRSNLEPLTPYEPFEFGTLWHSALEVYYGSGMTDKVGPFKAIEDHIAAWSAQLGNDLSDEDEEMIAEYDEMARLMFSNYLDYAPTVDDFEVLFVERVFEVEVEQGLVYSFKPDAVVMRGGRVWIGEWKTASKHPSEDTEYLLNDDQVGRYLWGLGLAIDRGMVPEITDSSLLEGVIHGTAIKRFPKPLKELKSGHLSTDKRQVTTYALARRQIEGKYNGEMPHMYNEYLETLRQERFDKFFFRVPVRRNPTEIQNVGKSFLWESREMTAEDIPIYRNPSAFNCNGCRFLGPCITKWSGHEYETILKGNYRERS